MEKVKAYARVDEDTMLYLVGAAEAVAVLLKEKGRTEEAKPYVAAVAAGNIAMMRGFLEAETEARK